VDNYLSKLTKAGKKVAICDQMTKPDGNGIVKREVVRVVTPGTTFDENILDNKTNNYVSSLVEFKGKFAFAFADLTTGDFQVSELENRGELESEIMRINPAECICADELRFVFKKMSHIHLFPYSYHKDAESSLKNYFNVKSLQVFGLEGKNLAVNAAGMLYEYLRETQKSELTHIQKINYFVNSQYMPLDEACIRNLELFYTSHDGKRDGTLISVLDQTQSAMGGRMLRNWLLHPLLDRSKIESRLNMVEVFVKNSTLLKGIRENLKQLFDIERLLSRLSLGTGNARDLKAMQISLEQIPNIKALILDIPQLQTIHDGLDEVPELTSLIGRAISDEAPISLRDGGLIKNGYNAELDDLRSISTEGKGFIRQLQEREIKRSGINNLKVKFNRVFGYYIEISNSNLSSVPEDYIRKQTLVNGERFITPELKEYEDKVLTAEDKIKELEYEIFYEVRMELVKEIVKLQKDARYLAILDVLSNFAFIAMRNNYCKPVISDDNRMNIVNSRHPVIEQINFSSGFVPNSCNFDENRRFLLITGPNMGGKSTYLRQVALNVLMAQIGSYVPAESAEIGIVDRIFTRVGASDNLVRGESTFMVEMQEAAYILNNASPRSLIILDELGRGTSTYDGLSIAWAVTEYIHDQLKSKTLFATHYHELVELSDRLAGAVNLSVAVRENEQEGVVFLYKIIEGSIDKSYGIEVAKLAGLPREITERASEVLLGLEDKDKMTPFSNKERSHRPMQESGNKILDSLNEIDINNLTPLKALEALNELKNKHSL
jgi:DNA mismatch repair protein MutS